LIFLRFCLRNRPENAGQGLGSSIAPAGIWKAGEPVIGGRRRKAGGDARRGKFGAEKLAQKVRGGQPILGVERHPEIGARWTLNRV
jgi:hypothetical protein